jgi:hypothetical protein
LYLVPELTTELCLDAPKTKRLAPAELCSLYASESPHSLELAVRYSARECGVKGPRTCALVILRHSEPYVTGSCYFGPASPSPLAFVLNIQPQRAKQQQLIFDQQGPVSARNSVLHCTILLNIMASASPRYVHGCVHYAGRVSVCSSPPSPLLVYIFGDRRNNFCTTTKLRVGVSTFLCRNK